MSPKLKCHQNWNVTKTEMSSKLKYHKNRNITKTKRSKNWNITKTPKPHEKIQALEKRIIIVKILFMNRNTSFIQAWGACILVALTVLQVVIFVGYSALYTFTFLDWNPDASITRVELYQWISVGILVIGMTYFLWYSIMKQPRGKHRNPNELYSYLALGVINNIIFIAKLCYYA